MAIQREREREINLGKLIFSLGADDKFLHTVWRDFTPSHSVAFLAYSLMHSHIKKKAYTPLKVRKFSVGGICRLNHRENSYFAEKEHKKNFKTKRKNA